MIKYIKKNQLNLIKYDACIAQSVHSRIYAFSWYLDSVSDNWDVLVLDDYKAVMPLPWKTKYFIKYIYPPRWTQQLGLFSKDEIDQNLLEEFLNAIPKKFKKVTLQLNAGNPSLSSFTQKVNYILPLHSSYETLVKGFNKNRIRNLKKTSSCNFELVTDLSVQLFLDFYKHLPKNFKLSTDDFDRLEKLFYSEMNPIHIWGVRENGLLIAALAWLKDSNRLTYLLPAASVEAKRKGAPSFLVAELIKLHASTNLILDFEGSMVSGVASFYKSFGAVKEGYYFFQYRNKLL